MGPTRNPRSPAGASAGKHAARKLKRAQILLAQAEVTIGPCGFGIDERGNDRDRMRDRERNHDRIRARLGDRDRDRGCLIVAVEERGEIHTVRIHCRW
jgi:hypothetical protein